MRYSDCFNQNKHHHHQHAPNYLGLITITVGSDNRAATKWSIVGHSPQVTRRRGRRGVARHGVEQLEGDQEEEIAGHEKVTIRSISILPTFVFWYDDAGDVKGRERERERERKRGVDIGLQRWSWAAASPPIRLPSHAILPSFVLVGGTPDDSLGIRDTFQIDGG